MLPFEERILFGTELDVAVRRAVHSDEKMRRKVEDWAEGLRKGKGPTKTDMCIRLLEAFLLGETPHRVQAMARVVGIQEQITEHAELCDRAQLARVELLDRYQRSFLDISEFRGPALFPSAELVAHVLQQLQILPPDIAAKEYIPENFTQPLPVPKGKYPHQEFFLVHEHRPRPQYDSW